MAEHPAGAPRLAQRIGAFAVAVESRRLPKPVVGMIRVLMLDVGGLCVAARDTDYVRAALASVASSGRCTAIGHAQPMGPYDAALVNHRRSISP